MIKVTKVESYLSPDIHFNDHFEWIKYASEEFTKKTGELMGNEGVKLDADRYSLLMSALEYRLKLYNRNYLDDYPMREGFVFEDFLGMYRINFNGRIFYIEIDTDPVHVLTRTTGRKGFSCEEINGGYWTGPFHDIALRNATAYIYDGDNEWIGRLNLRWTGNPEKPEIGLDPNIYPINLEYRNKRRSVIGLERWIHLILCYIFTREDGLMWYELLKTPYIYRGHSDTTISGNVKLLHKGLLHDDNKDILDGISKLLAQDQDIYVDNSMYRSDLK
ncbi:hypothetical protein CL614_02580 [archaeon]|nr:hypothetical protein [archaeon]|tara:strand:- start:4724 stop:5548 length:825 start_codon:yes stop_codon:yes gene_type:complete